jgi:hypothetical protein
MEIAFFIGLIYSVKLADYFISDGIGQRSDGLYILLGDVDGSGAIVFYHRYSVYYLHGRFFVGVRNIDFVKSHLQFIHVFQ